MPRDARAQYALVGYGLVVAFLLLAGFFVETKASAASLSHICSRWDERAADVVVHLVHEPNDVSLRQAGDALFRVRRARRNCRAGWLALSCQDYYAIVRMRVDDGNKTLMEKSLCALAMLE